MIQAILSYLIFTPSINIPLGFGDIETFPWALLFCVSPRLVLDRVYIYLMAAFGLSAAVTIALYGNAFAVARSYLAILNGSLIFFRLLGADKDEFLRLIQAMVTIFLLNLFISGIQMAGLFPEFIEPYYRMLVPRFTAESLGDGRGVGGLYAEPAYSSYAMHFMFAFMMLWWKWHPFERKGAITFLGMLAFDLFLNKSATGTAFLVILIHLLPRQKDHRQVYSGKSGFFAAILWLADSMEEPHVRWT